MQAAAILAAAEQEAAELRASILAMSAELSRMAAYVTDNLMTAAPPAVRPAVRPVVRPISTPAPSTPAPSTPAPRPSGDPAARPSARPRQYVAMRLVAGVMVGMLVTSVGAGSTELALHGYSFFVFRAAGTGVTPGDGLQESQGPGQPDAPGARQHSAKAHQPRGDRASSAPGGGGRG